MRRSTIKRSRYRCARFERCDERIVLSGVDLVFDVEPCEPWSTAPQPALVAASSGDSSSPSSPFSQAGGQYVRSVYGLRGSGQTVAVVDSGIAYDHEALGGGFGPEFRVVGGWDFTEENDADPYDDGPAGFHGTHVAGIIASDDPTRMGIAPGVDLLAVRVFNDFGSGSVQRVEEALQWIYDARDDFQHPITTVNLSLGVSWNDFVTPDWATLEEELAQLQEAGIVVVVAAGNSFVEFGSVGLNYPAVSPHVVPVASVDDSGNLSEFSQRGPRVLAGLGERVLSTVPDHIYGADGLLNDWAVSTGTSMAAPHIAGASVLVREAMQAAGWDSIAPTTIYEHLRTTADLVFDATTNAWYHRINLPRAVDAILFHEPVRLVDDKVVVEGTADDDVIDIELEDEFVVTLNGQRFTFSPASATRFEIAGGEGTDQLCVEGSLPLTSLGRESTSTILAPGSLDIHAISWQLSANDFEQVTVVAPGGYDDVARLYDSTNADEFVSHPDENVMRGNGFEHRVIGFDRVYAYASGQDDVATMLDSGGSDQFISRPDSSILKGRGFHNKALGFARVYAYASTGKDDVARFYDAPTKDHFTASPTSAVLAGDGFRNEAQGFFRTYAYSSGGSDEALLLDSTGSDEFVATAGDARLRGTGFFHKVFNFAQVSAIASEGRDDVARLHDSPHDDLFQATPKSSTLRGEGFANRATGFDRVYGYASDGVDQAQLTGSWASDRYYSWVGKNVLRGPGYYMDVRGFEQTHVDLVTGRDDVAYLFDSSQADSYVGAGNRGLWQAGGFTSLIDRLDRVRAFSDRGGNDLALLQASMPVMLSDDGSTAVLRDRQARHEVNDFEQVSTDGLVDEDYLATLDHLFEFAS